MGVCKECNSIYALRHKATGLIKIGSTSDWENRISALGCKGQPDDICDSLAVEHVQERDWGVYLLEKSIHCSLRRWRIPGTEWFHCDDETFQSAWSRVEQEMKRIRERQKKSHQTLNISSSGALEAIMWGIDGDDTGDNDHERAEDYVVDEDGNAWPVCED